MNVKLLGLDIDKELFFSEHITTVCKKVAQRIGLLKKIRYELSPPQTNITSLKCFDQASN